MDQNIENKLDYSPLHAPIDFPQILVSLFRSAKRNLPQYRAWLGLVFVACATLFYYETRAGKDISEIINKNMDVVVMCSLVFIAIITRYVWSILQITKVRSFAKQNKIRLLEQVSFPGYEGVIFGYGYNRQIICAYVLPGRNDIEIGNYEYQASAAGKNSLHQFGYIKIQLPRKLPHILLNSKLDDELLEGSLPIKYDNSQRIELEGNFNEFYTVYAPTEYHRDVFYIFTPDVMEALTKLSKPYNIEIVDDTLYLYLLGSFRLDEEHEIREIIGASRTISNEIIHQTKRYKDTNSTDDRAVDTIAPAGRILTPARLQMPIYVLVASIVLMCIPVYTIAQSIGDVNAIGLVILALSIFTAADLIYSVLEKRK